MIFFKEISNKENSVSKNKQIFICIVSIKIKVLFSIKNKLEKPKTN